LDVEAEVDRITSSLHHNIFDVLRRRGGVLGVSGGVDSAVVLALAVRALGGNHLTAILLPERESSPDSARLARLVCHQFGVTPIVEDVTGPLIGYGSYRRRDDAVRSVFPEYDSTYRVKITLPSGLLDRDTLNVFSVTIVSPEGEEKTKRLSPTQTRQIVAATNFKQRSRAALLYYHAELQDYAVIGTPQRNEHDQGFFVKYGDGAMDVKPIGHLYKTQVYQLARYLQLPEDVCNALPTTDTYSMAQGQDEFYFVLPYHQMDLALWAINHQIPADELATLLDISAERAEFIYKDIQAKRRTTRYLHARPRLIEDLPEIHA